MEAIDEITADLDWRETELGLLKVFFMRKDVSKKQHAVLARAAWSLLYAHYEGFAKFALTLFFERASKAVESCQPLPHRTREFALIVELKRIRGLPNNEFLAAIEGFNQTLLGLKPQFPDVDTKSNLWPNVLEDLLTLADITCPAVDKNRVLLKALVGKRNGIAHGEDIKAKYEDYLLQEQAVYSVMYELAYAIDGRLKQAPFA
ncbi:MAE_28990/MAE_18760 family HEPN-like nuclease [Agrobacterium rosae]|uniref:MAE_28990/MAE_18760 family HEPN-like nuclease n=1 Tax=Agrobacterium rosae TaxID=1972867 RepID=A0AAW9FC98_9HYPH|nr:MAE_28990/MAE_18760 family HEPN-like nuclease [Agrobacterium rosae]MDX8301207.1 MAE_28990/MAE_18760 family HEPN-like nuclease [Agrobacterium rosae]